VREHLSRRHDAPLRLRIPGKRVDPLEALSVYFVVVQELPAHGFLPYGPGGFRTTDGYSSPSFLMSSSKRGSSLSESAVGSARK
jgi:hypothetical protein